MKHILLAIIIFSNTLLIIPAAHAQNVQRCREQVARALENVMGVPGQEALHGYLKEMSDLTSTNLQTHQVVEHIEQLARDARLELNGICSEVARFSTMSEFYVAAYDLSACKTITNDNADVSSQLNVVSFCSERTNQLLDALLDSIRDYLLRQAVRTSMEPVLQRMRSLNSRLTVLITEYSRLVNNFFTFSARLGDTITGERD